MYSVILIYFKQVISVNFVFKINLFIAKNIRVFFIAKIDNPAYIAVMFKRFSFLIVSNAFFSVDSFFLLSGLLTSYLFMKEIDKAKTVKISFMIKFYVHRFWRFAF